MTDATRKCPVCGSDNPARAKFCGECGTGLKSAAAPAAARATTANPILPWFLAGVAVLAIHATVIVLALKRPQPASSGDMTNSGAAPFAGGGTGGTTGRPPDISNMTPREAADRLYDRIARASEAGDSGQVTFFGPMALQAYARVTPIDADARLHIGLIQLALGNPAGAMAEADSITRENRTHLFGPLLKARAAEAQRNSAAARQAWQQFNANYASERAKNLPEYDQHDGMLREAQTSARGGSR